jgi:hypothetical protein
MFETTTIGDYLERHPPRMNLSRIFSGSWISHDFNIWIGRREDNLAWDMLARTRRHLESEQERRTDVADDIWEKAWNAIYTAEGSDWFWWYGDDFSSAFDSEFDRLFRSYLMQVHKLLGEDVPAYLEEPIVNVGAARPTEQPTAFLAPEIDGRITHFYEWTGAGRFDVRKFGGAMNVSDTAISQFYWGFDLKTLFMRIDTTASPLEAEIREARISINFDDEPRKRIQLLLPASSGGKGRISVEECVNGEDWKETGGGDRIGVEKVIEFAIDFAQLGLEADDESRFHISVHKGPIEIERWPRNGYIQFSVPGEEFEATMWLV